MLYESGEKKDLPVQSELLTDAETKMLDLKNSSKEIEKVIYRYMTMPGYRK